MNVYNQTKKILREYSTGNIHQITPLTGGLINCSWEVKSANGHYVLQKLSDQAFDERVIEDQWRVLEWLHQRNFRWVPQLVLTNQQEKLVQRSGQIWRLMKYIDHDCPVEKSEKKILAATATLANFHLTMQDCPYEPIFKIKDFHDSPVIWENLGKLAFRQVRDNIAQPTNFPNSNFSQGNQFSSGFPYAP